MQAMRTVVQSDANRHYIARFRVGMFGDVAVQFLQQPGDQATPTGCAMSAGNNRLTFKAKL